MSRVINVSFQEGQRSSEPWMAWKHVVSSHTHTHTRNTKIPGCTVESTQCSRVCIPCQIIEFFKKKLEIEEG